MPSVLVLVIGFALTGTTPAQAGFSFTKPRLLTDPSAFVRPADFAPVSAEQDIAAWWSNTGTEQSIVAASVDERGRPGEPIEVEGSSNSEPLSDPSVAAADDGYTAIAWSQSRNQLRGATIRAAVIGPNGDLSQVHDLDHASLISAPEILLDSQGRPVVIWATYDRAGLSSITRTQLRWVRLGATGEPQGAVNVVKIGVRYFLDQLQFGIDPADRVTAAWIETKRTQVSTVRFGLDGDRGPLHRLGWARRAALALDLTVARSGEATIVWRAELGNERIQAVQMSAAGAEPGTLLDASGTFPHTGWPAVATGSNGRVAVAFERRRNGEQQRSRILIREIRADGTLGKLRRSPRGNNVAQPDLESDADGRLFAVWRRRSRGQAKIQVSRLSERAKVRRTTVAGVGVEPDLVISGGGKPLASWRFGRRGLGPERSPLAVSIRR